MDIEERLLNRALSYINYRPRSRREVEEKLKTLQADTGQITAVCTLLEKNGLIDDARLIASALKDLLENRGYGLSRIRSELRRRGFDPFLIEDALQEYAENNPEFSEEDSALALLQRKYQRSGLPEDPNKALGFLARRGFSFSAASKAIKACSKKLS